MRKLIGSKIENELRTSLIASSLSLFNSNNEVIKKLKEVYPEMISAYIVDWIPEQGENIYFILINGSIIVQIERNRENDECYIEKTFSIQEYYKKITRTEKLKLTIALELATKEMNKNAGK
jgi:peptide deformylase